MTEVESAYMHRKRADVALYRGFLESGDFESIRMLGHKMKGTGTGYGFPMLTDFGAAIEFAAASGDGGAVANEVEELAKYLAAMETP